MHIYLNGMLLSLLLNLVLLGYSFSRGFSTMSTNLRCIDIHYDPIKGTYSENKPAWRSVLFSVAQLLLTNMLLSWLFLPVLIIAYTKNYKKLPESINEIKSKLSATPLPPDLVKAYWDEILNARCISSGKIRDAGHDWSKNCEKCAICNVTRENTHKWDGCKCLICGSPNPIAIEHDWHGCKCSNCGLIRDRGHSWAHKDTCQICGTYHKHVYRPNFQGSSYFTCTVCGDSFYDGY